MEANSTLECVDAPLLCVCNVICINQLFAQYISLSLSNDIKVKITIKINPYQKFDVVCV